MKLHFPLNGDKHMQNYMGFQSFVMQFILKHAKSVFLYLFYAAKARKKFLACCLFFFGYFKKIR